ncbi:hypothetical protein B4U79_04575 [Dinothrombium tinctorium]|uniref:Uncharacterized protein n=1 Tax=Dinothrombium tinctorium TaxID=1965070 RepID=A0A443QTI5_9ACAR|nr:hypothetical protein B4U79_04575 [Dinothrombium tinctorium]
MSNFQFEQRDNRQDIAAIATATATAVNEFWQMPSAKRSFYRVYPNSAPESLSQKQTSRQKNKQESIKLKGDIILGGLFPMHDAGDERTLCGDIKEGKGIQRLEAMLYAIDMINADERLLPNLTLGKTLIF